MDSVYIETSIVSHATARPSADIQVAAMQQQARDWWVIERPKFEIVTSQLVIDEASEGIRRLPQSDWNCWTACQSFPSTMMFEHWLARS